MNEETKDFRPHEQRLEFDEDFSFLKFNPNSDSLELSISDVGSVSDDGNDMPSPLKSSELSDGSSWTPSLSLPDSFLDGDEGMGNYEELLGDLNLQSLGEAKTAKKIINRILNSSNDHDKHVLDRLSTAENFASHRGHYALRSLGLEIRNVKEENKDLRSELDRVKSMLAASKEDLADLVSAIYT